MPERILPILDLLITGFISTTLLIVSFGLVPIIVAILNCIYIISRIRRDANKYNNGNLMDYLKSIVKKNK